MDERINIVCETEKEFDYLTIKFMNKYYSLSDNFNSFTRNFNHKIIFVIFVKNKSIDWQYKLSSHKNENITSFKNYIRKEKLKRING